MDVIRKQKNSTEDKVFDIVINTLVILATIITMYPMYYVVLASISDPTALNTGKVFLWPVKPDLGAYRHILNDSRIWVGYLNTIIYTFFGTAFGVFITILGGYSLSRKDLVGRDIIMKLMVFTMFFSGGLIPTYMVIKDLGLVNTRYSMIILGSFSVFNLIITRTFFMSKIPDELYEAAQMDGCGNGRFFVKVVLPLSKEIVSVIVLYIAVAHWNSFFNALIYLSNQKLYPLQLVLREILVGSATLMTDSVEASVRIELQRLSETVKYGVMVVSTLPILALYPFLQRYFITGVMIGGIKG
jgi:putative aldouronate transport system permease protein